MIAGIKAAIARVWPVIRLRWMLFGMLLFVAALPGVGAIGLRVYENALVRRTEAELLAQSSALAASAALLWPQASPGARPASSGSVRTSPAVRYEAVVSTEIDLRSTPVLPERPPAILGKPADPVALAMAQRLAPAFAETRISTKSSILMLDAKGVLLNGRDAGKSLSALPELRAALSGRAVTVLRHNDSYKLRYPLEWFSRGTNIRLHHARPIKVAGQVVGIILVSRSPRALFRGMWEHRGKIAAGVGAIFALLVLLSMFLTRAIVRPIEDLSRATRALAKGGTASPRRPTLQLFEIRGLFDDFAAMAQSIARRSRYLRDFSASLSHEFKTPLAGIRGGIELLQDHGASMSPVDRERFLANMAVDSDRLARLVSRLMVLAQADMAGTADDACADLAPILARLADGLAGGAFAVEVVLPGELPMIAIEAAALETILMTLIENSRQAGASSLSILARCEGEEVRIDLADDGPGIPPGDQACVFDPFFTSKREQGGTGLGLPIARSLVENRRGRIELAAEGEGAHFILRLAAIRQD